MKTRRLRRGDFAPRAGAERTPLGRFGGRGLTSVISRPLRGPVFIEAAIRGRILNLLAKFAFHLSITDHWACVILSVDFSTDVFPGHPVGEAESRACRSAKPDSLAVILVWNRHEEERVCDVLLPFAYANMAKTAIEAFRETNFKVKRTLTIGFTQCGMPSSRSPAG